MTNKDLQNLFQNILADNSNIFDIYIQLDKFNKRYQMSDFYQTTKLNIFKAFEFYMSTVGSVEYTIGLFKNLKDKDMLDILDVITERLSIESILNTMEDDNKKLFMDLLPFIQK